MSCFALHNIAIVLLAFPITRTLSLAQSEGCRMLECDSAFVEGGIKGNGLIGALADTENSNGSQNGDRRR